MATVNNLLVANIRDTTDPVRGASRGTVIAKKQGDNIWWMLSAVLVVGFFVFLSDPRYFFKIAVNLLT